MQTALVSKPFGAHESACNQCHVDEIAAKPAAGTADETALKLHSEFCVSKRGSDQRFCTMAATEHDLFLTDKDVRCFFLCYSQARHCTFIVCSLCSVAWFEINFFFANEVESWKLKEDDNIFERDS